MVDTLADWSRSWVNDGVSRSANGKFKWHHHRRMPFVSPVSVDWPFAMDSHRKWSLISLKPVDNRFKVTVFCFGRRKKKWTFDSLGSPSYLHVEVQSEDDSRRAEQVELVDLFGNVLVSERVQVNPVHSTFYSTVRQFQPPADSFFFYIRVCLSRSVRRIFISRFLSAVRSRQQWASVSTFEFYCIVIVHSFETRGRCRFSYDADQLECLRSTSMSRSKSTALPSPMVSKRAVDLRRRLRVNHVFYPRASTMKRLFQSGCDHSELLDWISNRTWRRRILSVQRDEQKWIRNRRNQCGCVGYVLQNSRRWFRFDMKSINSLIADCAHSSLQVLVCLDQQHRVRRLSRSEYQRLSINVETRSVLVESRRAFERSHGDLWERHFTTDVTHFYRWSAHWRFDSSCARLGTSNNLMMGLSFFALRRTKVEKPPNVSPFMFKVRSIVR